MPGLIRNRSNRAAAAAGFVCGLFGGDARAKPSIIYAKSPTSWRSMTTDQTAASAAVRPAAAADRRPTCLAEVDRHGSPARSTSDERRVTLWYFPPKLQ